MEMESNSINNQFSEINTFIDALFKVTTEQALGLIQEKYVQVNAMSSSDFRDIYLVVLDSFWNFLQAEISVHQKLDFQAGLQQIQVAMQGFEAVQLYHFKELCIGFQLYFSAMVDLRTLNYGAGLEKIQQAKAQFQKIDKYGQYYAQTIDAMEAESLFVAGSSYIAQLDYDKGIVSIERASKAFKKLAQKYYDKNDLEYHLFIGLGYFYRAFSAFVLQANHLNTFNFEFFNYNENEVSKPALKAIEHLSKSIQESELAQVNSLLSKSLHLLAEVIFTIGKTMDFLLSAQLDQITFDRKKIKTILKSAYQYFVEIGEAGLIFIRISKQLDSQLNNVEKMLKVKKVLSQASGNPLGFIITCREWIKKGKILPALDILIQKSIDFDIFKDIILLKSRYSRMERERDLNLIPYEMANTETTKITNAILNILEALELEI